CVLLVSSHGASTPIVRGSIAPRFVFTDLGTLGGAESSARSINDSGQIVGSADKPNTRVPHPFLYSRGRMTELGRLNDDQRGVANSINDNGVMVGFADINGVTQPVLLMADNTMSLRSVGEAGGDARAINKQGEIVGSRGPLGHTQAFRYRKGALVSLGTLGG